MLGKCKECNDNVGMVNLKNGICKSCITKNPVLMPEKIDENKRVMGLALQIIGAILGLVIFWDYFQVTNSGYEWEWTNNEIIQIVIGFVMAQFGYFMRTNKGLFKMFVGDKK